MLSVQHRSFPRRKSAFFQKRGWVSTSQTSTSSLSARSICLTCGERLQAQVQQTNSRVLSPPQPTSAMAAGTKPDHNQNVLLKYYDEAGTVLSIPLDEVRWRESPTTSHANMWWEGDQSAKSTDHVVPFAIDQHRPPVPYAKLQSCQLRTCTRPRQEDHH